MKCENPNNEWRKMKTKNKLFVPKSYNRDFYVMWKLNIWRFKIYTLLEKLSIFFVYCVIYTPCSKYFEKWNKQFFWWTQGGGRGENKANIIPCHTLWICIALVHLHRALKSLSNFISRKKTSQMSSSRTN